MIAQDVLLGRLRVGDRSADLAHAEGGAVPLTVAADGGAVPRAVLTLLLVLVLFFEASTPDPLMTIGTYFYRGLGSWTGIPVLITPLEIVLMVGVVLSLIFAAMGKPTVSRPLRWPVAAFGAALAFGFARGFVGQGDMYVGLWEIRGLLYVPACFVIVRAAIRRPEHVAWILWAGLLAVSAFAAEGAYRAIVLIKSGAFVVAPEFYYEHEDVIFLAAFLALVASSLYFRVQTRLRVFGILAAPVIAFTLLASNRRAGIIVLLVALLAVALIVFTMRRKAFFATVVPLMILGVLYLGAFWNSAGVAGQPARAIRSLYEPDPRDASSNLYRVLEKYNIDFTLRQDPILGVGFGRPFSMVATVADLSWWPFWRYEPHNNVLWVWLKTGAIGYAVFWILIGSAMTHAALATRRLVDPALRTAALFCLLSLIGIIVFAYVDLGLVSGRVNVFLGTMIGLISVLPAVDRARAKTVEVRR